MLLVHPVHEVLRQLPLLIGSVVLGTATGNPLWSFAALVFLVAFGLARWFTTTYRIDAEQVQLRNGRAAAHGLSVPRNRIRSVSTDARLLHRLLGLTVLQGEHRSGGQGRRRRSRSTPCVREVPRAAGDPAGRLAPARPTPVQHADRARAGPLAAVVVAVQPAELYGPCDDRRRLGVIYQTGAGCGTAGFALARAGLDAAERLGVVVDRRRGRASSCWRSVLLSVLRSLLTFGNLVLRRDEAPTAAAPAARPAPGARAHLRHAAPARRDAARTAAGAGVRRRAARRGDDGRGRSGRGVAAAAAVPARDGRGGADRPDRAPDVVRVRCAPTDPPAARRRWTRALTLPAVLAVALVVAAFVGTSGLGVAGLGGADAWLRVSGGSTGCGRWAIGSTTAGWWRGPGSLERRRDCIAAGGDHRVDGAPDLLQRRAGVATLIAATAAGVKRYRVRRRPRLPRLVGRRGGVAVGGPTACGPLSWPYRRGPSCADTAAVYCRHHGYRWSALRHRWRPGDLVEADPRRRGDVGDACRPSDRAVLPDQHHHPHPRADRRTAHRGRDGRALPTR